MQIQHNRSKWNALLVDYQHRRISAMCANFKPPVHQLNFSFLSNAHDKMPFSQHRHTVDQMPKNDFTRQLRRQLQFLQTSSNAFDSGQHEEAVRLATTLRVLFHDTNSSTSLLKHLNVLDIPIATTVPSRPDTLAGRLHTMFGLTATMDAQGDGDPVVSIKLTPYGKAGLVHNRFLSAAEWWNEPIYILPDGGAFTRADIVKYAANKDGGAHVDKNLPDATFAISNQSMGYLVRRADPALGQGDWLISLVFVFCGELPDDAVAVENFLYFDIRQMATEVLNSPALLKLAEQ
ncbi:hypothetical protein [Duganella radicis]|uniref:Uncharacterized protein n=1 Tax=Duganella radicis TaxID=551988 RepID=A0A6L6PRY1_9BURK|nr:hypothetical protein [Duganella radicis]MTV41896.1 hypothetical protein [Duganella radicis]